MATIWLLCICRLQVNCGCAAKQKETFALMISFAASSVPCRFVATHVRMLRCSSLDLPSETNPIPLTCSVFSVYIFLFWLKWLCVLPGPPCTCVNACCDFHSVSNSVNIPSLVCSEHLQLLSLSSFSPSSPFLPLPVSIFSAHIFLWLTHRKEKD